jgi:hypothetical protein
MDLLTPLPRRISAGGRCREVVTYGACAYKAPAFQASLPLMVVNTCDSVVVAEQHSTAFADHDEGREM